MATDRSIIVSKFNYDSILHVISVRYIAPVHLLDILDSYYFFN